MNLTRRCQPFRANWIGVGMLLYCEFQLRWPNKKEFLSRSRASPRLLNTPRSTLRQTSWYSIIFDRLWSRFYYEWRCVHFGKDREARVAQWKRVMKGDIWRGCCCVSGCSHVNEGKFLDHRKWPFLPAPCVFFLWGATSSLVDNSIVCEFSSERTRMVGHAPNPPLWSKPFPISKSTYKLQWYPPLTKWIH